MNTEEIFDIILIDVLFELIVGTIWEYPRSQDHTHSVFVSNIVDTPTLQKQTKCPKCQRSVAVSRFAPHLEKCLGMGRQAASKPISHR